MTESIAAQIKGLQGMTLAELRQKWKEIFGEATKQRHKVYIIKRLTWQIQADRFGGLSDEATAQIAELRQEFETTPSSEWLRGGKRRTTLPPKGPRTSGIRDPRLPAPGTVLTRHYKGTDVTVKVLDNGFDYRGKVFRSLSAVAREVTGSHWSGPRFFGLVKDERK